MDVWPARFLSLSFAPLLVPLFIPVYFVARTRARLCVETDRRVDRAGANVKEMMSERTDAPPWQSVVLHRRAPSCFASRPYINSA